jgi:hypothetical protein
MDPAKLAAMPARAMSMPVLQLVRSRFPHLDDLDIEREVDSRKRVVSVQQDFVTFNGLHRHDRSEPILIRLKLIAHVEFAFDREQRSLHSLNLRGIAFAIGLLRRYRDAGFLACHRAARLCVKSVDDLPCSLEERHGIAARGAVNHAPTRIAQGVVKGDNARHLGKW